MARIYVRSPYIIEINVPLQQSTSIELFIWNGTGAAPASPQYTLSKNVPSANNVQTLYNISNYVREYLAHSSVQSIYNSTAATPTTQWCNVQVVKYSDGVLVGTESHNAFDGYGYYSEGSNFDNGVSSLDDGTYYYYNIGVTPVTNPLYYAGFFRASSIALGTVVYTNLRTGATQTTTSFNTPYDYPCVYDTLQSYGIDSVIKRYSATIATQWKNSPMGDSIYWYYGIGAESFYGSELIEQIEQQIDIPIIKAHLGSFSKKQLHDIYSQCFINLRLTPHDGCPNSNLQMGLMGRKSVYNGDLPYSLKWDSVEDIIAHIKREYRNRNKPNHHISSEFFTFVKNN